jgi:hypothetical protein
LEMSYLLGISKKFVHFASQKKIVNGFQLS